MENNNDRTSAQSPDEAKKSMKDKVAKGVATIAGALEGFAEEAKKDDLPQKSKQAIEKAGETTRNVADATKQQGQKVKESMTGSSSGQSPGQDAGQPQRQEQTGQTDRPLNQPATGGGLGRTAARPDSPGVMRRSEGHARSATAQMERGGSETGTKKTGTTSTSADGTSSDQHTRR